MLRSGGHCGSGYSSWEWHRGLRSAFKSVQNRLDIDDGQHADPVGNKKRNDRVDWRTSSINRGKMKRMRRMYSLRVCMDSGSWANRPNISILGRVCIEIEWSLWIRKLLEFQLMSRFL